MVYVYTVLILDVFVFNGNLYKAENVQLLWARFQIGFLVLWSSYLKSLNVRLRLFFYRIQNS
jgi:hypothetical protein